MSLSEAFAQLAKGKKLVIGKCSICNAPGCYRMENERLLYEIGCDHVLAGETERDEADLRALLEWNERGEWEWLEA